MFHDNCDDGAVFAPTQKMLDEGASCAFSIELADGKPMLRGMGVVRQAWSGGEHRFGAPGLMIAIEQLTTGTQSIHARLLEAHAAAARGPRRARSSPITQIRVAVDRSATERSEDFEDESLVHEVHRSITSEIATETGAAPTEVIDERASHTTRYDALLRAPAPVKLPAPPRSSPTRPPPIPRLPAVPAPVVAVATAPMFGTTTPREPAPLPAPPPVPSWGAVDPATTPDAPVFARGTPVPPEATPVAAAPLAGWPMLRSTLARRARAVGARLAPLRDRLATWTAPVRTRLARWLEPTWHRVANRLHPAWAWLAARVRRGLAATTARVVPWWRIAAVFAVGIIVGKLVSSSSPPPSREPPTTQAALPTELTVKCAPEPPPAVAALPTPPSPPAKVSSRAAAKPTAAAKPSAPHVTKPTPAAPATANNAHATPPSKKPRCKGLECI